MIGKSYDYNITSLRFLVLPALGYRLAYKVVVYLFPGQWHGY